METNDDSIGTLSESGIVLCDSNDVAERETTAAKSSSNNNVLDDVQEDSDVVDEKNYSEWYTAPTPNRHKKSYKCSRCGKPLKGHTCTVNQTALPKVTLMTENKRSRVEKRRFSIDVVATEKLSSPIATTVTKRVNRSDTRNLGKVDESLRGTGKKSNIRRPRNWYDDSDDARIETTENPTARKEKIYDPSVSENTDGTGSQHADHNQTMKVIPQASSKRPYTCRMCGTPRKGHVCPYVGGGSTTSSAKRQSSQQQVCTTPFQHDNNKQQKQRSEKFVSVMERIDYNTDSSDDDEEEDDEDKVPCTEILIPAHIFFDEIHSYIAEQRQQQSRSNRKTTEIEKHNLQMWATNVHSKFVHLNERANNEVQRTLSQKKIQQSIMKERDVIMTLRNKIRCIQNDNRTIADHIISLRKEHDRNIAASSFLFAIDALR